MAMAMAMMEIAVVAMEMVMVMVMAMAMVDGDWRVETGDRRWVMDSWDHGNGDGDWHYSWVAMELVDGIS